MSPSPKAIKPITNNRPLVTAALGFSLGIFFCGKITDARLLYAMCPFIVLLPLSVLFKQGSASVFIGALLCGVCRYRLALAFPNFPPAYIASPLLSKLGIIRNLLYKSTDALFFDLSPLFRAMLWGDTSILARADAAVFRTAGLAHILALSGLHVGFFAGALLLLIPKNHPKLRFWSVSVFVFLYCCIAAFPASLVRAGVMTVCTLGAALFFRSYDLPCSLSLSALLILLIRPDSLFDVGFQLSFSAVAGIAMLSPVFTPAFNKLPKLLAQSVSVSASATIGTLPLSLLHFQTLPLYSLLSNLVLLPLVPFSLITAFAAVLLGLVFPAAAELPAFVAYHLMLLIKSLTALVASLPYACISLERAPGGLLVILSYCAMFCVSPYLLLSADKKFYILCIVLFFMLVLSFCGILFI